MYAPTFPWICSISLLLCRVAKRNWKMTCEAKLASPEEEEVMFCSFGLISSLIVLLLRMRWREPRQTFPFHVFDIT